MDAVAKIRRNPKYFYSYARKFSTLRSGIGPFLNDQDELISDNFEMAEMLRVQYEKAFSKPLEKAIVQDATNFFKDNPENTFIGFPFIHIDYDDVIEAIDSLSLNAAPGPDYFPAILLKKAKYSLGHGLKEIYQSSLESGEVPEIFKMAFVTPIHKSGAKTLPVNYRPVSLTSHIAKPWNE